MRDAEIRQSFHRKRLKRYHADRGTLVIDELGLRHGTCRADIAVVNGRLLGFEIKSDRDALSRLPSQISAYNAVFGRITIIAGERHVPGVWEVVPHWWGIVLCTRGRRGGVHFATQRRPSPNPLVDALSVAKLLWRSEVVEILQGKGVDASTLRRPRRILQARLVETMRLSELRETVRSCLVNRKGWRCPQQPC